MTDNPDIERDIPEAVWSGEFKMGDVTVRCYVLDNGQRIINADDLEALFSGGPVIDHDEIIDLARWCKGK